MLLVIIWKSKKPRMTFEIYIFNAVYVNYIMCESLQVERNEISETYRASL